MLLVSKTVFSLRSRKLNMLFFGFLEQDFFGTNNIKFFFGQPQGISKGFESFLASEKGFSYQRGCGYLPLTYFRKLSYSRKSRDRVRIKAIILIVVTRDLGNTVEESGAKSNRSNEQSLDLCRDDAVQKV